MKGLGDVISTGQNPDGSLTTSTPGTINSDGSGIVLTETSRLTTFLRVLGDINYKGNAGIESSGFIPVVLVFSNIGSEDSHGKYGILNNGTISRAILNRGAIYGEYSLANTSENSIDVDNTGLLFGKIQGKFDLENYDRSQIPDEDYEDAGLDRFPTGRIVVSSGSNIDGTLTYHGSDGELWFNLNPSTDDLTAPVLSVSGKADFSEGANFHVTGDYRLFGAQSYDYTLIEAGELVADAATIDLSSVETIKILSSELNDTRYKVTVKRSATTGEQAGEGGATDQEQLNISRLEAIALDALNNGSADQKQKAQELLSLVSTLPTNADIARIAEEFLPDINGNAVASGDLSLASSTENILKRSKQLRDSGQTGINTGDKLARHGIWMMAVNQDAEQDSNQGVGGYDADGKGFSLGYDVQFNDDWTIGTAVTYANMDVETKGSSDKTSTDTYQLSLYSSWEKDDYFVDSSLNIGRNKNDSQRIISSTIAKADYDSDLLGLNIIAGKAFEVSGLTLTPKAAVAYNQIQVDGYTEQGSVAGLSVKEQSYESVEVGLGASIKKSFEVGSGILTPEVNVMAYRDLSKDPIKVTYSYGFAPDTVLSADGQDANSERYQVGLSAVYDINDTFSITASYDVSLQPGFQSNTASVVARYEF